MIGGAFFDPRSKFEPVQRSKVRTDGRKMFCDQRNAFLQLMLVEGIRAMRCNTVQQLQYYAILNGLVAFGGVK